MSSEELPEGALTLEEALERYDRLWRLYDTLAGLVRMGARSAARTMVAEVDSGEVQGADRLTTTETGEKVVTGWVVRHMADAMAAHLDAHGGPNWTAWAMVFPADGVKPLRELTVTAQWKHGSTPQDLIRELTEELEALKGGRGGLSPSVGNVSGNVPTGTPSPDAELLKAAKREAALLREAARALYGMDDTGAMGRVTPEALRAASTRLGWTQERTAERVPLTGRSFERWGRAGHAVSLPVTSSDAFWWPRDVADWATGMAGVDIAPCEALALALELA